jgi:SagB-type dehydrogenase family enzyme
VEPYPTIRLPERGASASDGFDELLSARRSIREFSARPLTEDEIGRLLWAAQGVTSSAGGRTTPSAGGLYPLELYVATADGVFRYLAADHRLEVQSEGDVRGLLYQAGLEQTAIRDAPAVFVVTGVVERTESRYGDRAERYVILEAGHAAQNMLLQAVALELGAVPIGAFDDDRVTSILGLVQGEVPLYLIPVGDPA